MDPPLFYSVSGSLMGKTLAFIKWPASSSLGLSLITMSPNNCLVGDSKDFI